MIATLFVLSFHPWALALLIGIGALVMTLIGRPEDVATTGITTTVVLIVAVISPRVAWQQPILRLVDTAVGTSVGLAAALWMGGQPISVSWLEGRGLWDR